MLLRVGSVLPVSLQRFSKYPANGTIRGRRLVSCTESNWISSPDKDSTVICGVYVKGME